MAEYDPQALGRALGGLPYLGGAGYPRDVGTGSPSNIDRLYAQPDPVDPRLMRAANEEGRNYTAYQAAAQPYYAADGVTYPGAAHDYEGAAMNRGMALGSGNALQEHADTHAQRALGAFYGITPDYYAPHTPSPDEVEAKRMGIAKAILSAEPGPVGAAMAVGDASEHASDAYSKAKSGETRDALISSAKALGLLVAGGLGFKAFAPAAREASAAAHGAELPVLNAAGERVYRPAMPWEPREAIEAMGGRVRLGVDGAPLTREIPYGFNPVQEERLRAAGADIGLHSVQEGGKPVWQIEAPNAQSVPRGTDPSPYPREAPLWEVPATRKPGTDLSAVVGGTVLRHVWPDSINPRNKMIQAVERRDDQAELARKEWKASTADERDEVLRSKLNRIDTEYHNTYTAYNSPSKGTKDDTAAVAQTALEKWTAINPDYPKLSMAERGTFRAKYKDQDRPLAERSILMQARERAMRNKQKPFGLGGEE